MTRWNQHPRRSNVRRLTVEALEQRQLLDADELDLFGFSGVTASIPPDHTPIGFRTNVINDAFDSRFGTEWRNAIREAIQTWASVANINIGLVTDDGTPAGAIGPWRGDERFGDIRLFGVDLPTDTWAEAVSEGARGTGSWAGDIIFNTAADWTDLNDLKTAAIHELGHVLGLGHSEDPASPMHSHGPSGNAILTAGDIAAVQSLHGARLPDANEGEQTNDVLRDASRIRGSQDDETALEGFNGQQVWIQFGDLQTANDIDFFEVRMAKGYSGPLAIEVRTAGLSLAELSLQLLDRREQLLDSTQLTVDSNNVGILELETTESEARYYIRIAATNQPDWHSGTYSVTVLTPERLTQDQTAIAAWGRDARRWYYDSGQAKNGFSYQLIAQRQDGLTDDDGQEDDNELGARDVPLALNTSSRTVFSTVGTITTSTDVDHWRILVPETISPGSAMLIDLQSLTVGGLVPEIQLLDRDGFALPFEYVGYGYGATQLLVKQVQPDDTFVIRVSGIESTLSFSTGNYSLVVEIGTAIREMPVMFAADLGGDKLSESRDFFVARTQLFAFGISGTSDTAVDPALYPADTQFMFRLLNADGESVLAMVAPLNQLRSFPGLLLDPGQYLVQASLLSSATDPLPVHVRVTWDRPSLPIGPLVANAGEEPLYSCPEGGNFCYPNGTQSPESAIVGTPPSEPPPPINTNPLPVPPEVWFWQNVLLPTNPFNFLDVNGDGIAAPIDALIVINYINRFGAGTYPPVYVGHLDVNGDHLITPIDALRVINAISHG